MLQTQNNSLPYLAPCDEAITVPFFNALEPEPIHLTVSEWAAEYRYLSPKASAEPGPWTNERTPYLIEPMDALSPNDPCEVVCMLFGSQLGKTETGLNWVGYIIDIAPGPMLMVNPTDKMSDKVVTQRLDPAINETPKLKKKVSDKKSRDSTNSKETKEFPGGILLLSGANSPANLASMPIRYLFADEVDRWPGDVGEEGDPLELARARTRTFGNSKQLVTSTPTKDGASRIMDEFELTDQRHFFVPCPDCNHKQTLKFKNLIFDVPSTRIEGQVPEEVHYACEECGVLIPEHKKTWMLEHGEWIAQNPLAKRRKGFFMNSLYSPVGWYSWEQIATDFLDAKGKIASLKTFVNTVLAEPWKEQGDAPDWEKLYRRRDSYDFGTCPTGVLFLTAGVDIQRDRIELEIVGWGRNKRSWSIDYIVIPGETSKPKTWEPLWALLDSLWHVEGSSVSLPIAMMAVDSSDQTQMVYNEVRKQSNSRVMAVKGIDAQILHVSPPKVMDINFAGKKIARGVKMWPVGVSQIKEELYGWFRLEPPIDDDEEYPSGWCSFPQYEKEFFRQLTAEERTKRTIRGRTKFSWEVKYERNEALDCRVYSRAAAYVYGLDRFTEEQYIELEQRLAENQDIKHNSKLKAKKVRFNPVTNKKGSFL